MLCELLRTCRVHLVRRKTTPINNKKWKKRGHHKRKSYVPPPYDKNKGPDPQVVPHDVNFKYKYWNYYKVFRALPLKINSWKWKEHLDFKMPARSNMGMVRVGDITEQSKAIRIILDQQGNAPMNWNTIWCALKKKGLAYVMHDDRLYFRKVITSMWKQNELVRVKLDANGRMAKLHTYRLSTVDEWRTLFDTPYAKYFKAYPRRREVALAPPQMWGKNAIPPWVNPPNQHKKFYKGFLALAARLAAKYRRMRRAQYRLNKRLTQGRYLGGRSPVVTLAARKKTADMLLALIEIQARALMRSRVLLYEQNNAFFWLKDYQALTFQTVLQRRLARKVAPFPKLFYPEDLEFQPTWDPRLVHGTENIEESFHRVVGGTAKLSESEDLKDASKVVMKPARFQKR